MDCATRHCARYPSGRRKGAIRFQPCGTCPVGAAVAADLERAGWTKPPDSWPAEVLSNAQRAARNRWQRSFPAYATPDDGRLEPFAEAALCAPDDGIAPADVG